MNGFSAEWLALRGAADERARWREGAWRFLDAASGNRTLPLADLASGSGANCAYLSSLATLPRDWLLVDHDVALLARARDACTSLAGVQSLSVRELDLSRDLDSLDLRLVAGVSAAALLDLVSQPWLERLIARCAVLRLPLLFALSYDGTVMLTPGDADDEHIRLAVNQHQRSDKGFGPALGPTATSMARSSLLAAGYRITTAASDWQLDATVSADATLLSALLHGWANAASELAQTAVGKRRVTLWLRRRERAVANGGLQVRVGHQDLLALP
jgi:hypothetical protein